MKDILRRISLIYGETDALYHDLATRLGLTDSAFRILYTLMIYEAPCPLARLCRLCGLSKQTVNSAIRKFEGEGVLYLTASGARGKDVHLTEEGQKLVERTVRRVYAMENAVLDSWPQEDLARYYDLSERYLRDLAAQVKDCFEEDA